MAILGNSSTFNISVSLDTTYDINTLGVDFNALGLPSDIKSILETVAGDLPDGETDNTKRPRYDLLKGPVAMYAGFYHDSDGITIKYDSTSDNKNNINLENKPRSTTSQPNRSIDKLSFYIMFRLPFKNDNYNVYYGDPLSTTNTTSWSYRANALRTPARGLKKLNSAGEQVAQIGGVWKKINDAGEDLDNYTNLKGYEFLGVNIDLIFKDALTDAATKRGILTPAQERSKLFDHSDNTQPVAGYNKIPPYFPIMALQENQYNTGFWLQSSKNSSFYSRGPHFPANVGSKKKNRKFIRFTTNPGSVNVVEQIIKKEATTNNLFVEVNNVKYYLELSVGEQLSSKVGNDEFIYESLSMAGSTVKKENNRYLVEFDKVVDAVMNNDSGITAGTGLDLGGAFKGFYKLNFDITLNPSATGKFRLYYWDRVSDELSYTLTKDQLKSALNDLIIPDYLSTLDKDKMDAIKALTTVSGAITVGTNKKFSVTILREKQAAFSHPIYSVTEDHSQINPNVIFSPNENKDWWKIRDDEEKDSWYAFTKVMNYSFSNQPFLNGNYDEDFWLKQNNMNDSDQKNLKSLFKFSIGVARGRSYALYSDSSNKTLLQKLEFKSYVQALRSIYNEFFIPRYFNKTRKDKEGKDLINYSPTIQKNVLDGLINHPQPNQAELNVMASLVYNNPSKFSSTSKKFIKAIKQHSLKELKSLVEKLSTERRPTAYNFIGSSDMIKNIYRGIED